jgi:hypothetical protein
VKRFPSEGEYDIRLFASESNGLNFPRGSMFIDRQGMAGNGLAFLI